MELEQVQDKIGFKSLLARRDFLRLWVGQAISNIGSSIGGIALLFFAWDLGQSPAAMALLAMMQIIPQVVFAGAIGVYVDKWDRKTVMIVSDFLRFAIQLAVPFVVLFPSFMPPMYWLYILAFFYATVNAFFFPARSASIPNLVDREELVTANSLSQMTFQLVSLIVTPVGGVIVALVRPYYFPAFALDAATFLLSGLVLMTISASLKPKITRPREESFLHQIIDGGRVILRSRILMLIISLFTVLIFGGGMINALIAPYFEGELHLSELELSLILSASGLSGVIAAAVLGSRSRLGKPLFIISGSMITGGVVIMGLSLVTGFYGAIILFSLIGLVNVALNIPSSALMQEIVTDEMRGRVFSFQGIMINISQLAGMAIGGFWAELAGTSRPPIFTGGLIILLAGILGTLAIIRSRMHDKIDQVREDMATEASLVNPALGDLQDLADSNEG